MTSITTAHTFSIGRLKACCAKHNFYDKGNVWDFLVWADTNQLHPNYSFLYPAAERIRANTTSCPSIDCIIGILMKEAVDTIFWRNEDSDATPTPCSTLESVSSACRSLHHDDKCELVGCFIDLFEDWLTDKGLTAKDIPNKQRENNDEALILGDDYDLLAEGIAQILGIEDFSLGKAE